MIRYTTLRRVHLFSALVPQTVACGPHYLTSPQLETASAAIAEREPFLGVANLSKPFQALTNLDTLPLKRITIQELDQCVDIYRAELSRKSCIDPRHRLQLHEAIMAAGFYRCEINPTVLRGESTRFVVNHYNFDVRRDTHITNKVHESLLQHEKPTSDSEQLLSDILLLERRLFGKWRFAPTAGIRWFVLGLHLSEVKTEEELQRLISLPVIKREGNFSVAEVDSEKLWKTVIVQPMEEDVPPFVAAGEGFGTYRDADAQLNLRIQKPPEPVPYWDRVKDVLLRYWVIWFSLWVMFFMVDEEILTVVALIFLKYKQTKILQEEAERSGGKVYIASAHGRSV